MGGHQTLGVLFYNSLSFQNLVIRFGDVGGQAGRRQAGVKGARCDK